MALVWQGLFTRRSKSISFLYVCVLCMYACLLNLILIKCTAVPKALFCISSIALPFGSHPGLALKSPQNLALLPGVRLEWAASPLGVTWLCLEADISPQTSVVIFFVLWNCFNIVYYQQSQRSQAAIYIQ